MPIFRCNACKGTYSDTLRDGTVYMHACPPLPPDERGIEPERENKRDETIGTARGNLTPGIRSEGAGVTPVSHKQLSEPAWITRLKKQIAKEEEEQ